MKEQQYNWEHFQWPNFVYSALSLKPLVEELFESYLQSIAKLKELPVKLQQETLLELLVDESYSSSKIENIEPDRTQLRSSLARRLSLPTASQPKDKYAQGMTELILKMRESRVDGLTDQLLFDVHTLCVDSQPKTVSSLGVEEIGRYRTLEEDMLVTDGGRPGEQKIYFKAPPAHRVQYEMGAFIEWFNRSHPKLAKNTAEQLARVAISHLWFESIHPFEDGNGRIGRAISDLALCQMFGHSVLISISQELEAKRSEYYAQLNQASGYHVEIDDWIHWFCLRILAAQKTASESIDLSLTKHRWWQSNSELEFNNRQMKAINRMFDFGEKGMEGGMTARKYQNLTSTSKATATRDLTDLEAKGVLVRNQAGGRSTSYSLGIFESTSRQS